MKTNSKLIYLILYIVFFYQVCANIDMKSKSFEVSNDLLTSKDLPVYLNSIERALDYYYIFAKEKYNMNLMFGFFLVNVNLRPFVNDSYLPLSLRDTLRNILTKSDILKNDHRTKVLKRYEQNENTIVFFPYTTHDTFWARQLVKLNFNLLEETLSKWNESQYPDYESYKLQIYNLTLGSPTPALSDFCLQSLSVNVENYSKYTRPCFVPEQCRKMVNSGSDFGYFLTHRLVFLIEARYGYNCAIITKEQDDILARKLCTFAYREADFIAMHGLNEIDLLFEQIALCTLYGHAQFLRRSWIFKILKHQTKRGCFLVNLLHLRQQAMNETCFVHLAATAAAGLASAVRFILENY